MSNIVDINKFKIPSIYSGDISFLEFNYTHEGKQLSLGKLMGTKGVFSFEGDLEPSAEVFFQPRDTTTEYSNE